MPMPGYSGYAAPPPVLMPRYQPIPAHDYRPTPSYYPHSMGYRPNRMWEPERPFGAGYQRPDLGRDFDSGHQPQGHQWAAEAFGRHPPQEQPPYGQQPSMGWQPSPQHGQPQQGGQQHPPAQQGQQRAAAEADARNRAAAENAGRQRAAAEAFRRQPPQGPPPQEQRPGGRQGNPAEAAGRHPPQGSPAGWHPPQGMHPQPDGRPPGHR